MTDCLFCKIAQGTVPVAFLFTGGDIAHAHAHVVPMHENTDITSARYIVHPAEVTWASAHLRTDAATLERVKAELGYAAQLS
jgi:histidine triad (HIT) family protein